MENHWCYHRFLIVAPPQEALLSYSNNRGVGLIWAFNAITTCQTFGGVECECTDELAFGKT